MMRAPLKWAGGKSRLLSKILETLPPGKRLIEPFVGSGTVFFNSDYPDYWLNDINKDLISFYQLLKEKGPAFIKIAESFFEKKYNQEKEYYRLRDEFNSSRTSIKKAALFLYLNKHGYNGLCRYNSHGKFNVPFGRYTNPYFPKQALLTFHEKLQRATLTSLSFAEIMQQTKKGDVIYCDPPYVPLTKSANFTKYHTQGFDEEKQHLLAGLAKELSKKKIPVILSNHDTALTRKMYKGANLISFSVRRTISCQIANRASVKELLAIF